MRSITGLVTLVVLNIAVAHSINKTSDNPSSTNNTTNTNPSEVKQCVDLFSFISKSEYDMIKDYIGMCPHESYLIGHLINNKCNVSTYLNLSHNILKYKYNISICNNDIDKINDRSDVTLWRYLKQEYFGADDQLNQYQTDLDKKCYDLDTFFDSCPQIIPLSRDNLFEIIYSMDCAKIFIRRYPDEKNMPEVRDKVYSHVKYSSLDDHYYYVSLYPKDFQNTDFENNDFKENFIEAIFQKLNHIFTTDPGSSDSINMVQNFLTSFPNETDKILQYILSRYPYSDMKHHIDQLLESRPDLLESVQERFFVNYVDNLRIGGRDNYYTQYTEEPYFSYFSGEKTNATKQKILLDSYRTDAQIEKFLVTFPEYSTSIELVNNRTRIYLSENAFMIMSYITFVLIILCCLIACGN